MHVDEQENWKYGNGKINELENNIIMNKVQKHSLQTLHELL